MTSSNVLYWWEYEILTREICEQVIKFSGQSNISVKHDIMVSNGVRDKQVDVYWEAVDEFGRLQKNIVECKCWKSSVKAEHIESLEAFINSDPNMRGIYVTKIGYQKGALRVCEKCGIIPFVLKEPDDKFWKNRIHTYLIRITFVTPECDVKLELLGIDDETLVSNSTIIDSNRQKWNPEDFAKELIQKIPIAELVEASRSGTDIVKNIQLEGHSLTDGNLNEDLPEVRLICSNIEIESSTRNIKISGKNKVKYVFQNKLDNNVYIFGSNLNVITKRNE